MSETDESPNPPPDAEPKRRHKWWLVPFFAIVTIAVLVSVPAPMVIEWYLKGWITAEGGEDVEVANVDINLVAGSVLVEGLAFLVDGRKQEVGRISANLNWTALPARRLYFSSIRMADANTTAKYSDTGGLVLAAIALEAHETVEDIGAADVESEWGFGADLIELTNVVVFDRDEILTQGPDRSNQVTIEKGRVEHLAAWDPDNKITLDVHFSGGDQHLYVKGTGTPFAQVSDLRLDLKLQDMVLNGFKDTLAMVGLEAKSGIVSGEQEVRAVVGEADGGFKIDLDGDLTIANAGAGVPGADVLADSLIWNGHIDIDSEAADLVIAGKGRLDATGVNTKTGDQGDRLTAQSMLWDGEFRYDDESNGGVVTGSGVLNGEAIIFDSASAPSDASDARDNLLFGTEALASTSAQWRLGFNDNGIDFDWSGDLELKAPILGAPMGSKVIGWSGEVGVRSNDSGLDLTLGGALQGADVRVDAIQGQNALELGSVDWKVEAELASREGWTGSVSGDITVGKVKMGRPDAEFPLLTINAISGSFDPAETVGIGTMKSIKVDELRLLHRNGAEGPPEILSVPAADVDRIDLLDDGIAFGQVVATDLKAWFDIDADGNVEYRVLLDRERNLDALADRAAEREERVTLEPESSDSGFGFSIAGVTTTGDTQLDFRSRTVTPEISITVNPLAATLGMMDSNKPDQPTPMNLEFGVGKYTTGTFDGTINLLAESFALHGKGTVTDMDIALVDGYVRRGTGYAVHSGTLAADLDIGLDGDVVDSNVDLTIRHLELRQLDPDEEDPLAEELGMGLGAALALLENKKGIIKLEVPIEGDLSELSAGFGDAFRQVMQKGVVAGVRTAATAVFAPLWPALAVQKLWEKGRELHFKPVLFEPGSVNASAGSLEYVTEVARMAKDRHKINLTVCGVATSQDRTVLYPEGGDGALSEEQTKALEDLEARRQELVKDKLIELGVQADRVVTCSANFQKGRDGEPRVDVGY